MKMDGTNSGLRPITHFGVESLDCATTPFIVNYNYTISITNFLKY